jgi:hypothetical protein
LLTCSLILLFLAPPDQEILTADAFIVSLCNTAIGRNTVLSRTGVGYRECQSPSTEESVSSIIDGSLATKHVTFGIGDSDIILRIKGVGTGFIVVPTTGNMSIIRSFQFGTANDSPNRDPITVSIEGSQMSDQINLEKGSSWNLIYLGWTGIDLNNVSARSSYGNSQSVSQTVPYRAYRFIIASQRGADTSVQYSEIKLFGYFLP